MGYLVYPAREPAASLGDHDLARLRVSSYSVCLFFLWYSVFGGYEYVA